MRILKYKNYITLILGIVAFIATYLSSQLLMNALIAGVIVVILALGAFNYLIRRVEVEGHGITAVIVLIVIGFAIFYFM